MNIVPITSGKFSVVFRASELPRVNPSNPVFALNLNGVTIAVRISPKAARKLAAHPGGAVLQGKLVASDGGSLSLLDAGFNWLDAKPATEETSPSHAVTAGTTNLEAKCPNLTPTSSLAASPKWATC